MDVTSNIGKTIKDLRKRMCMTQSQLGEILGVGQKSVSMIENGTNNPTLPQIQTMVDFFGVSSDFLLFGKNYNPTDEEREMLRAIRSDTAFHKAMNRWITAKNDAEKFVESRT